MTCHVYLILLNNLVCILESTFQGTPVAYHATTTRGETISIFTTILLVAIDVSLFINGFKMLFLTVAVIFLGLRSSRPLYSAIVFR